MKECKTTQMKEAYSRYLNTAKDTLRDVYKSWSGEKEKAFNRCKRLQQDYEGERFRIIGANQNYFSVGFVGYINGRKAFFFITKSNDRFMYID